MLYSLRLLLFLINVDQIQIWFDGNIKVETHSDLLQSSNINDPVYNSIEFLKFAMNNIWQEVQDGLKLTDIENIIFFLVFVRFIILIFRYNLKTSTYITCIGVFAGYLWYRHLIDIITMYSHQMIKIPYLNKLGNDAMKLEASSEILAKVDMQLGSDVHWYNPGKLIYYAFTRGIIHTDPNTGFQYYIDPISMAISNLNENQKALVLPYYYKIYNVIIPRIFATISGFWQQLSGVAAYAVITRIGKRYCPYLVRWHWTLLLIIGFLEQIIIYFLFRVMYFQENIIAPKMVTDVITQTIGNRTVVTQSITDPDLLAQFKFLNVTLIVGISIHIGGILFGLLHAFSGQYFYFPFLVENAELHIGPRSKNSIYSGGQTAWQDEKRSNVNRKYTKLWYGWFGHGTKDNWITGPLKQFFKMNLSKFIRLFRK